jgi:8-oxo-dGTP pyrophosphatase MutT (NUDIX family)
MSLEEKEKIMTYSFYDLWKDMWGSANNLQYKNEEYSSLKKKEIITDCVCVDNKIISLKDIINNSKTNWIETEWEFPKGRRNLKEKDFICAIREFEEEPRFTNYTLYNRINCIEEVFKGSNLINYKHVYYIAGSDISIVDDIYDTYEIGNIGWYSYEDVLKLLRPYSKTKIDIINQLYFFIISILEKTSNTNSKSIIQKNSI